MAGGRTSVAVTAVRSAGTARQALARRLLQLVNYDNLNGNGDQGFNGKDCKIYTATATAAAPAAMAARAPEKFRFFQKSDFFLNFLEP